MKKKNDPLAALELPKVESGDLVKALEETQQWMTNVSRLLSQTLHVTVGVPTITAKLVPEVYGDDSNGVTRDFINLPDNSGWEKGFTLAEIIDSLNKKGSDIFTVKGNEVWIEGFPCIILSSSGWRAQVSSDTNYATHIKNPVILDKLNVLLATHIGRQLPPLENDGILSNKAFTRRQTYHSDIAKAAKECYRLLKDIVAPDTTEKEFRIFSADDKKVELSSYLFDDALMIKFRISGSPNTVRVTGKADRDEVHVEVIRDNGAELLGLGNRLTYQEALDVLKANAILIDELDALHQKVDISKLRSSEAISTFKEKSLEHDYHLFPKNINLGIKVDHTEIEWSRVFIDFKINLGISKQLNPAFTHRDHYRTLCGAINEVKQRVEDREHRWMTTSEVTKYFLDNLMAELDRCYEGCGVVYAPFVLFSSLPLMIDIPSYGKHIVQFKYLEGTPIDEVMMTLKGIFELVGMEINHQDNEYVVQLTTPVPQSPLSCLIDHQYELLTNL